jgi:predicted TIM-barrel fold metal-dependent hydrolase
MERDWSDLPLRDYRPEPTLRVPTHDVLRAAVPAVDAHNHLGLNRAGEFHAHNRGKWRIDDVSELVALMDECNLEAIVNLDGHWSDELEANLDRYDRAHPGRFVTFCRCDWRECANPGWEERLAESVRDSAHRGAAGLKIEKKLGLAVRDERGAFVLCDDSRLEPLWQAVADTHLPVLIHVGDPAAFFEPLSEQNERLEQLLAHPDWHFAEPSLPPLTRLLDGLERLVADHPEIAFIGAHVGCHPEDLAAVGRMLDGYPNFNVDICARVSELGRQPRAARRLVLSHPTRVLFGTDELPRREMYSLYFRFLETDDEYFSHEGSEPGPPPQWMISGVDLPLDVLREVYAGNARRLIVALPGVP